MAHYDSNKLTLTISDAHKMTYKLLTSPIVGLSFGDIRVEHKFASGNYCDLYLTKQKLGI